MPIVGFLLDLVDRDEDFSALLCIDRERLGERDVAFGSPAAKSDINLAIASGRVLIFIGTHCSSRATDVLPG